jgi:hypothetical protein
MDDIEKEYGPQRITSIYRINDSGVHGTLPVRGTDFGINNDSQDIRNYLNHRWIYDPIRPGLVVCKYGDNDLTGRHDDHVHIQVHRNTKLRGAQ